MSKTKTLDIYDEVWVMVNDKPTKKIILEIEEYSYHFKTKTIHVLYGLVNINSFHKDLVTKEMVSQEDVFKDKQTLMNSVFDLDKEKL